MGSTPVVALIPPGFATTWATGPDDGTDAKAADVRQIAQIALTNDSWIISERESVHSAAVELTGMSEGQAFETFTSTSWVTSTLLRVDIAGVKVGDDLEISLTTTATWDHADNLGQLRLLVIEDFGGAAVNLNPTGAKVSVSLESGAAAVALVARRRVVTAGTARVAVQGRGFLTAANLELFDAGLLTIRRLRRSP